MKKLIAFLVLLLSFLHSANAQWEKTNGPFAGFEIRCMTISDGNIYAGTESGVYFSSDNGDSWVAANNGLKTPILSLTVSGNSIYVGTIYQGIFLSTDNGKSWKPINSGLPRSLYDDSINNIHSIVIKGTTIFTAIYARGIFVSTNNGTTWTHLKSTMPYLNFVNTLAVSGNTIYAGTTVGIYLSNDDGLTWTEMNKGLTNTRINSLAVNGTVVYAGTDKGVFISTNNALNWTSTGAELSGYKVISIVLSDSDIFAGTYSAGIFLSSNNGISWTAINSGIINTNVNALAINGNTIFAGAHDGMYKSSNKGSDWIKTNSGLSKNTCVGTLVIKDNNVFAGTGNFYHDGSIYSSSNYGSTWMDKNSGLPRASINVMVVSGDSIFAGTSSGLFLSADNGSSWRAVDFGMASTGVNAMVISGNNVFAGTQGGVFLSPDKGNSWVKANNGLVPEVNFPEVIGLAVNGPYVFASVYAGGVGRGVYRSSDNGSHWNNAFPTNTTVSALALSGNRIFAGTLEGVYVTSDNGGSWVEANNGLPEPPFPTISSIVVNNGYFFITYKARSMGETSHGVYYSSDNGTSWSALNNGLSTLDIWSLSVTDDYIYAGTGDDGIWKFPLLTMGVEELKYNEEYFSVFPNPSNDKIIVEFSSLNSTQSNVLSIYDLQGQVVFQQLIQAEKTVIDISGLAKGIYMVRIKDSEKAKPIRIVKM